MHQELTDAEIQVALDAPCPVSGGELRNVWNDTDCGPPLRVWMALEHSNVGLELSEEDRFYATYDWFFRTQSAYARKFGPVSYLEAERDRFLKRPAFEIDWDYIARLEARASF